MTPIPSPLRRTLESPARRSVRLARRRRRLQLESCEDRSIPSATAAAWSDWSTPLQLPASPAAPAATLPTGRVEIVFIDPRVDNYRSLITDLQSRSTSLRRFEIYVLSTQRDGIDQVSAVMARYRDVDAVHFVSHGNLTGVQLGGSWVDQATLAAKASHVAGWSHALRPGADLLFYGCNLAAGDEGRVLLDAMRSLTGADVAASTDRTGSAALGGDWLLEYDRGRIETAVAFSAAAQSTYGGVFATFTVTSTADSGVGTLRQAILDANSSPGADTIDFKFPGKATRQIALNSALPALTGVTTIDGTTLGGYSGTPIIELVGSAAGAGANGLVLQAACTIRGLAIHSFGGDGILITSTGDGSVIEATHLGLDGKGKSSLPNGGYGIEVDDAQGVRIGGPAPSQRNLISSNKLGGLRLTDNDTTNATVQGNWIGVDISGQAAGNGGHGILIDDDASQNLIGGTGVGEGNVIAHSVGDGVRILVGTSNRILGNSIYANGGLGIDLDGDGPSANDKNDSDGGGNEKKNFPVLTTVVRNGSQVTITGTYHSVGSTQYRLEFFANSTPDASGYGEGETFLGFAVVTTDFFGNASFSVTFTATLPDGATVAATATDLSNDNTSEFSAALPVPGVWVQPTSGLVTTEAGGTATFTIVLTSQPTGSVTVPLSVSSPAEGSLSTTSVVFTTANWNVPQTVTITGIDDLIDDGDQPYTIIVGAAKSSDSAYNKYDAPDVSVINADDDVAGIIVSPTSGLTTTEAGGTATFTVVLTSQPTAPVTVFVNSSNAAEGTPNVVTLTFTAANWNIAQTVTITGVDDFIDDGNQPFTIVLTASSADGNYAVIDPADVAVTNLDDDSAGIIVSPTSGLTTTEAGGTATFTVVLTSQPTAPVTVFVNSSNPTEGTPNVASLTFTAANWNIAQTVTVTGTDDFIDDGDQGYTIVLTANSADGNYAVIDPADVAVTNLDNDAAGIIVSPTSGLVTTEAGGTATFTVVLTSQPVAPVTVFVNSSNAAEGTPNVATLTFTAANWNIAQTVTITGVDDFIDDGDQGYTIVLSANSADGNYAVIDPADVAVTSLDDDSAGIIVSPTSGLTTTEAGGTATFTVVLTSQPVAPVTVFVNSSNAAEGTPNVATLTFTAANWNIAQTVTVTGVDDSVDDGDQGYTIVLTANSADGNYAVIDPADVAVTNLDNDSAGIIVSPTSGLTTTEAGGTATFTVVLTSQPVAPVTVFVNSSNAAEGTPNVATLTFTAANWNIAQTVTVTGVDDFIDDGNQPFTIVLTASSADGNYAVIDPADVAVTNLDDDSAGIIVSPTSGLVTTEAGGTASFTVVLTSQPVAPVTVFVNSSNAAEGTPNVVTLTFTAANWNIAQTVTITGVDDFIDDGNQPFTIVLTASSADGNYAVIDPADVSATNVDNDTAGIIVSPTSGLTTTEAGGTATFTVVLTSQPVAPVTVFVNSSNAAEGTPNVASLTFTAANWNIAQTVTITGVDDFIDDGDQGYTIVLSANSADGNYAVIDPADVAVTNLDNDAAGIIVSPTSGLVTTEAGGTASFTVVLTSQPTAPVTVFVNSSNPTEGTPNVATLTFTAANWNIAQTVTVTGTDDFIDDGDQGYTIVLTASSADGNYAVIDPADAAVTNLDNDAAGIVVSPTSGLTTTEAGGTATFTVVLTSQPVAPVTVFVNSSNPTEGTPNVAALTFTAANWNIAQTVTITGVDDSVDDGDQGYTIVLTANSADGNYAVIDPADVAVTNLDNDSAGIIVSPTSGLTTTEAGGTATFTVVLTSQPVAPVTVFVNSSNSAEGTPNVATLTFTAANWNIAQTVTVTGTDDFIDDGDQGYTIVLTASSADGNYAVIDPADVAVTSLDDDSAGIIVSPTSGLTTTEAGGTATFTVVLTSQPVAPVTVFVNSSNAAEGTPNVATLTFTAANWNIAQTVTVTGTDDFIDDGDQGYTIVLTASSADGNYAVIDPADAAVTNLDNDAAGIVVSPTSGLTTTEAGGTATFTVVLTSQPVAPVTVFVNSSNPTEGTPNVASLTFTAANWNIAQTVTITGVDDFVDDGDQPFTIVLTASSADGNYAVIDPADVAVTNLDNDSAGIIVSPTSGLTTTEAGGTATFTVVLTSQPTAPVTVFVNSSNAAEGTPSVASLTFTAANWNVAQTVTITGVDDFVDDGDQPFTIVLTASSADGNYAVIDPADVAVTNLDDDGAGIIVSPTSGLVTTEAGGTASFTVVLTSQPTAPVTVFVNSSNPAEGTPSVASLTFTAANWNIAQTVTVTGTDDFIDDGDQPFTIVLTASSADGNYAAIDPADVAVTNIDNDSAGIIVSPTSGLTTTEAGGTASFTVVLTSQPVAPVTVFVNSSNAAEGTPNVVTLTFTAANWNVAQTVTVTGTDDFIDDGDQGYTIVLTASSADGNYAAIDPADVSATNVDNDTAGIIVSPTSGLTTTEAGGTASFTVVLTSQPTAPVTVFVNSSNAAEGTPNVAALTFTAANWNIAQTVTITGVDDFVDDGDQGYTILLTTSSADSNYAVIDPADVAVTNLDDDGAGIIVSPTSGLTTTEAGGTASFTVVLTSQPVAPVTVFVNSSNAAEGTPNVVTLTFTAANWNIAQTVTITGVDDFIDDGNQPFTIVLTASSADSNYAVIDPADVAVTNLDNDSAGIVVAAGEMLDVSESGGSAAISVRLQSQPVGMVIVGLNSGNPAEGTLSANSLVFTPSNWNIPQAVTVTGVDDFVVDGDIVFSVQVMTQTSVDVKYVGMSVPPLAAVNRDDDVAGFRLIAAPDLMTTEGGGGAVVYLVLTSQPTTVVTLVIDSGNPGEITVLTPAIRFGPDDWNQPRAAYLRGVADGKVDNDAVVTIEAMSSSDDPNYRSLLRSANVTNRNVDSNGLNPGNNPPLYPPSTTSPPSSGGKLNDPTSFGRNDPTGSRGDELSAGRGSGGGEEAALAEAALEGSRPDVATVSATADATALANGVLKPRNMQPWLPGGSVSLSTPQWHRTEALTQALEKVGREFNQERVQRAAAVRVTLGTAAIATAGYLLWTLRGVAWLASAVASSAPTWRMLDPLCVLKRRRDDDDVDDEALDDLAKGIGKSATP